MRPFLVILAVLAGTVPAFAQMAPGSIGNGGRMPETMSPGALAPPAMSAPREEFTPPLSSYGARYPSTAPAPDYGSQSTDGSRGYGSNTAD